MKIFKGILVSSIALTAFNGVGSILPSEKSEVAYAATYNYSNKQLNSTVHKQVTKQLILKFKNEVNLPYQDGIEKFIKEEKQDPELIRILAEYPNVTINRLFNSLNPKEIKNLGKEIKDSDHISSNLLNYYIVETQDDIDVQALLTKFEKSSLVETAYLQEEEAPPAERLPNLSVNPYDEPRLTRQGYLEPAPLGINAPYAWSIKGGDGKGTTFVDMEYGWLFNHEDLVNQKIELISGQNKSEHHDHGTSVLGIVSAEDNNIGGIGIAPKAKVKVVSQIRDNGNYNTADAILSAVNNMQAGDILLLEAQATYDGYGDKNYFPVEVKPDIFDAIRMGTNKGIIIIEAGANGGNDLDQFRDRNGKQVLNRNSPDFKDSGAIMVGAASARVPHKRSYFSNYGSRVDVYGWGNAVDTTDAKPSEFITNLYTSSFAGTSSASPIIAGAAASIQGIAKNNQGRVYTPSQLRDILSDSSTGTKSNDPTSDKIGVLPDLKAILSKLGFSPNLGNDSSIVFPEEQEINKGNKGNEGSTITFPKEDTANSGEDSSFIFPE
ncbi:S8 family serine peptidase [Bacillus cereus]|uniref:Peptidase S8/S53 domain-containing protein n=1 Tax=Bacillus cereus ISP2954 TaxID=1053215 RepID=A0A9W5VEX7_BACCE|nr:MULTISPECIES: S8 family peptidase [Bacillus cereus group]AHZ54703.1 peptidase S8 and S53 subtilisin kexin sedolisin [Bacillus thuringiensis serovar kurstaki str. YBT-1520]AIE37764.1 peptidase S8 and S53 subtilisin kexin sedolisin [Bacillus thuringiensis serovar kurstaki str. HD-1]AIM34869.1 extracellular alkaline serine protease [Bacillus thuringiensis serovar kurstaki str. YBT-1520]AJK37620.1 subtilase family protein [Bacillus thuringiensis serovar kurstaki]AKJ62629.1 peptidase S8 [Bacillu